MYGGVGGSGGLGNDVREWATMKGSLGREVWEGMGPLHARGWAVVQFRGCISRKCILGSNAAAAAAA